MNISYKFVDSRVADDELSDSMYCDGACGWVNGTAHLDDGRTLSVGGGWLNGDGSVEPYAYSEMGDVDELADALGKDIDETMAYLRADCPAQWGPDDLRGPALWSPEDLRGLDDL